MFKIKILLLIFATIFLFGDDFIFGKSSIVESRTIDGTTYHIVQANAKIMNNNSSDGGSTGKVSIVYNNLLGKVAVSQNSYNDIPNVHNEKVTIYYLIKDGEESKQMHELFFNRKDISFPVYSLDKDNKNYNKDIPYESKSKAPYDNIYLPLFILFLILSNFFDNRSVNFIPIKIRLILQAVIIIVFFTGANKVINIENKECSQSIIKTIGTVKYHVSNQPYIIFKNCNGDNSRSQMNILELKSYNEYSPITVYYSQETQEDFADNRGHRFTYKVFFSEEDFFNKSETLLRKKVAIFMLLIWLYFILNYRKKLTLPTLIQNKYIYYKINPYNEDSHKLLFKIDSKSYGTEDYDTHYKIYTDSSNKIHIKRTNIFSLILPTAIFIGLIWALLKLLPGIFMSDIPSYHTTNVYIITTTIFAFAVIFFLISIKNISAIHHIGIFSSTTELYQAFDYDKTISFNKIYGITMIYKEIEIEGSERTYYEKIFILDLLLQDGEIINLVANENRDTLLAEAKIISAYTQKPIFDLGKWNYHKLNKIYKDTLTKKNES